MAKEFRAWVQDIKAPEEFFYATLARIDQKSAENAGRFSVVQGIFLFTSVLNQWLNNSIKFDSFFRF